MIKLRNSSKKISKKTLIYNKKINTIWNSCKEKLNKKDNQYKIWKYNIKAWSKKKHYCSISYPIISKAS